MAKQSYKQRVASAVAAYTKGSRNLVILFEEAATRYWNEDSRTVENLSIFLNAINAFPVLQKAAVETTRTFGKFNIDLKDGVVTIANRGKVTEDQRAKYVEAVQAYVAKEYNSLLAAHQNKLMDAFDLSKRMTGFENSATTLVVNALANDATLTQAQMVERLTALVSAIANKDLTDKITEKRLELEADKISPEAIEAAAANAEPVAENAQAI